MKDSDREWEKFGRERPYFGVLTQPQFQGRQLGEDAAAEFFQTGEAYVAALMAKIAATQPHFRPRRVLDFGCGVGRLLIPFAGRCDEVTGVDVSESMLARCREHCDAGNVRNATLVLSDDSLSRVSGRFDLVHSYIVLQHIHPRRGMRIIRRLLDLVADGGVAALEVPVRDERPWVRRAINVGQRNVPWASNLANLARGRAWGHPLMAMHIYDLFRVIRLAGDGIQFRGAELARDESWLTATLFFQRGLGR
jgi:SAM-dependent methyltransferase